eukprot:7253145-Prymnesium_polylepis.1
MYAGAPLVPVGTKRGWRMSVALHSGKLPPQQGYGIEVLSRGCEYGTELIAFKGLRSQASKACAHMQGAVHITGHDSIELGCDQARLLVVCCAW